MYVVPRRLSIDPQICDLNDLELPFYHKYTHLRLPRQLRENK